MYFSLGLITRRKLLKENRRLSVLLKISSWQIGYNLKIYWRIYIIIVIILSTWYCGHYWPIVAAPDDRWWWLWSNWWNEAWQGKPKYSENTCTSATLSTTNPIMTWPWLEPWPPRWEVLKDMSEYMRTIVTPNNESTWYNTQNACLMMGVCRIRKIFGNTFREQKIKLQVFYFFTAVRLSLAYFSCSSTLKMEQYVSPKRW
jgi:hypothetical protein